MRIARSRRRGYICIWGTTNREKIVDYEGVELDCPGCRQKTRMLGKAITPYCSVFYIPLFAEGKGHPFIECTRCGGKFNGDAAAIRAEQRSFQARTEAAIGEKMRLYRERPGDTDLACEIVELLAASDRVNEALELATSLVQSHPENANVRVMLGRIHLHRDDPNQALAILQQAIACNPANAAAHYFSALALVHTNPQRLDEALAAAKRARDCGHPEARDLIQSIEQATR